MTPTVSISIHDPNNLGDQVCNPCDYFEELKSVPRLNAWDLNWIYQPESMILGGGGMVHGLLAQLIEQVPRYHARKLIAWGLGHNQHNEKLALYRNVLQGFDLIGVRDFKAVQLHGHTFDYVPCASCLEPVIDAMKGSVKPHHAYVVYSHWEAPVNLRRCGNPLPWMANDAPYLNNALYHLASGDTVITNSYHGAYWALLLGRKVLIYKPFSSRFYDFKYQPPFVDEHNWKDIEPISAPAGYLEECRALNRAFYEKVKTTLGISDTVTA